MDVFLITIMGMKKVMMMAFMTRASAMIVTVMIHTIVAAIMTIVIVMTLTIVVVTTMIVIMIATGSTLRNSI